MGNRSLRTCAGSKRHGIVVRPVAWLVEGVSASEYLLAAGAQHGDAPALYCAWSRDLHAHSASIRSELHRLSGALLAADQGLGEKHHDHHQYTDQYSSAHD